MVVAVAFTSAAARAAGASAPPAVQKAPPAQAPMPPTTIKPALADKI